MVDAEHDVADDVAPEYNLSEEHIQMARDLWPDLLEFKSVIINDYGIGVWGPFIEIDSEFAKDEINSLIDAILVADYRGGDTYRGGIEEEILEIAQFALNDEITDELNDLIGPDETPLKSDIMKLFDKIVFNIEEGIIAFNKDRRERKRISILRKLAWDANEKRIENEKRFGHWNFVGPIMSSGDRRPSTGGMTPRSFVTSHSIYNDGK